MCEKTRKKFLEYGKITVTIIQNKKKKRPLRKKYDSDRTYSRMKNFIHWNDQLQKEIFRANEITIFLEFKILYICLKAKDISVLRTKK